MPDTWPQSLIQLQPRGDTEYISQGRTVLVCDREGWVDEDPHQALWIYQASALSRYRWLVNGKAPQLSAFSQVKQNSSLGYYISAPRNCKKTETHDCDPAQHSLELRVSRTVGEGMHEDIELTNHTQIATTAELALEIASDFASPAGAGRKSPPGRITTNWRRIDAQSWELTFDYKAQHAYSHQGEKGTACVHRGLRLLLRCHPLKLHFSGNKLRLRIKLAPRASWHACLNWIAHIDGRELPLEAGCNREKEELGARERKRQVFLAESTHFASTHNVDLSGLVLSTVRRSASDLLDLRLFDLDAKDRQGEAWTPAAGLPTYLGLFGRDSLAAGWQAALLSSSLMRGVMAELPQTQGTKIDDWRDEQPGRLVHELHTDPRALLNFVPHARYYGGVTASMYYPVILSAIWHWTGDKQLLKPHIDAAVKSLEWADRYSCDNSGFYKYQTRSKKGEKNQGWKDSSDAIVYPDGSQVADPLGTCEMQAFVYASKLHLSEVLWWLDEKEMARQLFHEAEELKKRFNDKFWMEHEGYFGMAVDSRNRLVKSVASDPGHCLASGIVDEALIARTADRMMQPDMFSGWGIRTLSADHPAYNPFSYHRGSVWPVENAVFVLAFARYGLHDKMNALAQAMFESAALFKHCRLPEVFAGHPRDDAHPFPGMYPRANWPQAWSASAPFTILQGLLGIYPYAPLNVLFIDPHLPTWLPEISLERMRVGEATISLHFQRTEQGATDYRVTDQHGALHVIRQPSPWSLTAGFGERVKDAVMSLLPGK